MSSLRRSLPPFVLLNLAACTYGGSRPVPSSTYFAAAPTVWRIDCETSSPTECAFPIYFAPETPPHGHAIGLEQLLCGFDDLRGCLRRVRQHGIAIHARDAFVATMSTARGVSGDLALDVVYYVDATPDAAPH